MDCQRLVPRQDCCIEGAQPAIAHRAARPEHLVKQMTGFLAADPEPTAHLPHDTNAPADDVPSALDQGRFQALRTMAGADLWPEIFAQLHADLDAAARALGAASAAEDPALVRAQTHVLMAVAGTVGGTRVQRHAEALNALAHEEPTEMAPALAALLAELGTLCAALDAAERGRTA